jgi:DNA primase
MAYSGLGYVEAVQELAASAGMQMPQWQPRTAEVAARMEREIDLYAVLETALDFYRAELKKSRRAIDYLKGRGLSGEIAARFRIGYAPDDWQGLRAAFPEYQDSSLADAGLVIENDGKRYDRFRDRVMFPILNARGATIGFGGRVLGEGEPKYLNSPETPLFEKGREIYGLPQAREAVRAANRIVVVEGYMDVLGLAQHGVGYAVATLGTATTPVHVSKLLRLVDELVFCFDGDSAGRKAAWRALEVSLPLATDAKPIRFVFLPEEDDPDSFVRKHGASAFERWLGEAQTLSGFLLGELRAAVDLATPEGRSRLLVAAKPHLQKVTAPALRLQLVKEIAILARVSQDEAERLLELRSAPYYARSAPAAAPAPIASALERKLLRFLLQRPKRIGDVDPAILGAELPESAALGALAAWWRETGSALDLGQGMLIDRFQGTRYETVLFEAQYGTMQPGFNDEELDAEIDGCLRGLRVERKREQIEVLKTHVRRQPENRELQAELVVRTRELALLKGQRI